MISMVNVTMVLLSMQSNACSLGSINIEQFLVNQLLVHIDHIHVAQQLELTNKIKIEGLWDEVGMYVQVHQIRSKDSCTIKVGGNLYEFFL